MSLHDFEPVFLPAGRQLNGRVSQTFLRHYTACPRSAYLYALFKDEASTPELQRGRALHEILARATAHCIEHGEVAIPGELVKVIANEVLADPEFAVPFEEHDYLRECAYRWASQTAVDVAATVAVETLLVLDVGGWQVRARVDYAALLEDGAACRVLDYKSSRWAPAFEDVARRRPDGTLMAKNFQLVLYALMLAQGYPVRVEERDGERVEVPEPFALAGAAHRFDLEFVYPGIEDREGKILTRPMSLTQAELDEYRESLAGLIARVAHSVETGDWPAVVSDAACGECPASSMCPIPREVRDHRGTVNSMGEAAQAAAVLHREKAEHRARQAELREFAKQHGPIRFGGMVWELVQGSQEEIRDKDGMWAAMERSVQYGEPFERERFVRVKQRTDFKARDLTADELAENEGSK